MITITNVGPHDERDTWGVRTYEVKINNELICTFQHRRGDGLAECLRLATIAVERKRWSGAARFLDKLKNEGKEEQNGRVN